MARKRSNAAGNLPKGKNEMPSGVPFKKGYDPRRNMKGRPKAFDQWRALAQDVMQQIATNKKGTPIKWNGEEVTFAEFVLLSWAMDKKYQEKIVEAAFGKVPQPLELIGMSDEELRKFIASRVSGTGDSDSNR